MRKLLIPLHMLKNFVANVKITAKDKRRAWKVYSFRIKFFGMINQTFTSDSFFSIIIGKNISVKFSHVNSIISLLSSSKITCFALIWEFSRIFGQTLVRVQCGILIKAKFLQSARLSIRIKNTNLLKIQLIFEHRLNRKSWASFTRK